MQDRKDAFSQVVWECSLFCCFGMVCQTKNRTSQSQIGTWFGVVSPDSTTKELRSKNRSYIGVSAFMRRNGRLQKARQSSSHSGKGNILISVILLAAFALCAFAFGRNLERSDRWFGFDFIKLSWSFQKRKVKLIQSLIGYSIVIHTPRDTLQRKISIHCWA